MSTPAKGFYLGSLWVAGALGFGLARWTAPPPPTEEVLRRFERQEARLEALARKLEAPAPTGSQSLEDEASSVAFEKARRLVDASLASRRWGDAQRDEFSVLRRQLSGPRHQELLRELVRAINSQQLRVETNGPAF